MPKQATAPKYANAHAVTRKKGNTSGGGRNTTKNTSPRDNSAIPPEILQIFPDLKMRSDGPPGPRIAIGEALRERGLDEYTIAEIYVHVVGKLAAGGSDSGGVQKLLVDVLKECSRQIEASQPPMRSANPDAPVIVQLVHTVTRPVRA
jgi:hypothetical protein